MTKIISSFVLACSTIATMTSIVFTSGSSVSYACPSCQCVGNRPGALTLTLGSGYFIPDSKRSIKKRATGMVELGWDFNEHWGIEGMLTAFRTHFKNNDIENVTIQDREIIEHDNRKKIGGTLFTVASVYHFLPALKFQPYVLAGVGILGLSPNHFDAHNSGIINAAIGAQYFINKIFSVRVEARGLYTWVGGYKDIFVNAGLGASFDFC